MVHEDTINLLRECDVGKNPDPMAKSMSWLKTNVKLGIDMSDAAWNCVGVFRSLI